MSECDLSSICVQKPTNPKFSGAILRHAKTRASVSDVEKTMLRWEDRPGESVPTCCRSHPVQAAGSWISNSDAPLRLPTHLARVGLEVTNSVMRLSK